MGQIDGRQIQIHGMAYAPTNEQGVVFLFGRLAPQLGFCIEQVQVRCPDCTARRSGKLHRIEFEFRASHFLAHRHSADDVDIIVCWENDWESRPRKYRFLEIIELKRYSGALPRIFSVGCNVKENARDLGTTRTRWNVPNMTQVGDLILIYRSYSKPSAIHDAWEVVGPFEYYKKNNRHGEWPGLHVGLRKVASFSRPATYNELKRDPKTRNLKVVKGCFMGKREITEDWPLLCDKIVRMNPSSKKALAKFQMD